ncbi:MMPL family transporter [Fructilactobacillus vespulae]|uniref:MMPL family transporter n=1 Tax=Fructilactobacillus vespulae TaxID=1249630 RepID=UPI0039B57E8E
MNKFLKKYSWVAALWAVIVVVSVLLLPNIGNLEAEKGQTKIPDNMQSQVANNIEKHWGHNISNTNQVVLIYNNGDKKITKSQQEKINDKVKELNDDKDHYNIKGITSVVDTPSAKGQLISKDKTTELVQLNVSKDESVETVNKKLQEGGKVSGMKSYVTGAEILNDDMRLSMVDGLKKTEIIAVIFILIVLILVFKSPVVPLISLLTVGVSFIVSLSVVMNLVKFLDFPLSNFTQVFMVVVLFGIGTDYNILLYNQFKENLANGMDKVSATISARKVAGKTIRYSGISVLIGFAALGLAKFSIYRSGFAVGVGVIVLLLVLLSLNPFFMVLLGKKMYWPAKNLKEQQQSSALWGILSSKSVQYAAPAVIFVLVVTLPFIALGHGNLNYDQTVELKDSIPSKAGLNVVEEHFSKGTAEPSTIYIKSDHDLANESNLNEIDRITNQLRKRDDVKTVASVTQPNGVPINKLYVNDQLETLTGKMSQANDGIDQIKAGTSNSSFNGDQLKAIGESAQSIGQRLQAIQASSGNSAVSGQEVIAAMQQKATAMGSPLDQTQMQIIAGALQQSTAEIQNKQAALGSELTGIASDTQNIGNNTQAMATQLQGVQSKVNEANQGLDQISTGMVSANDYLQNLQGSNAAKALYIPTNVLESETFQKAVTSYLSENKKTTKITVVLNENPSSSKAIKSVNEIQNQVKQNLAGTNMKDATVAVGGQSATIADTNEIAASDFNRTAIIMTIGILIALMFVTKSILQPVYIIATLLISYAAALSLTHLFSSAFLGQDMLTWTTPFFAFIMIIALGVDYSIFLMQKYQDILPSAAPDVRIVHASKFIGVVVLSAALILGGTFAALIPSGVLTLIQVAIAVIIGLVILVIILPILMAAGIKLTYPEASKAKHEK